MPQCLLPAFWNELCHGFLLRLPCLYRMGREMSQHARRTSLVPHYSLEATSMPNGTARVLFDTRAVAYGQSLRHCLKSAWKILILPVRHGLASGNTYASAGKASNPHGCAREAENLDGHTSHATGAFIRLD